MSNISLDALLQVHQHLKASIHLVESQIRKELTTWQSLALHGFKVEAIIQYREETSCDLRVAKDNVESFLSANS